MRTNDQSAFLDLLEEHYQRLKGVSRTLRPSDHIADDLGIDSLASIELLAGLEEELGILLIDDPRIAAIETVENLRELVASARPSSVPDRSCA